MSALDSLVNGNPQYSTGTGVTSTEMPQWYSDMMQAMAGRGAEIAGQGYQSYPGERQAAFTPDQEAAFANVRSMQGGWQPGMANAEGAAGQILPTAAGMLGAGAQYAQQGVDATGGNAQAWTDNWQKYMSPYTSQVVDEIGRLGNQNLNESILPGINNSFIGNGGFGSSRNAAEIGRGVREAQTNITGQQSLALQSGYGQAADIFASDANRAQAQQQMQSGAALSAGQLANAGAQIGAGAADTAAQRYGALSQLGQDLGYKDVASLGAAGAAQQSQQQAGYDIGYKDFQDQTNYDWTQLGNINSILHGMQLPTTTTQTAQVPVGSTSPLSWVNAMYGISQATPKP